MKIEKIKKNHKKEIIIGGLILISVVLAITLVTTRAKYRVTQNIKLAKGIVNYKPYDFKIMAMYKSDDGSNYTEINEMPTSGYVINEEKSYCTTDNTTQVKGKIKTENGKHYITGLNKSDKCYIWFDKKASVNNGNELLAKVQSEAKDSPTKIIEIADTDEGVFKVEDGMYGGYSYYWRGAATTNHMIFADKCWRIVRINGDGTIRLIYNGTVSNGTCSGNGENVGSIAKTGIYYNSMRDNSSYVGWTFTKNSQRPSTNVPQTSGTASYAKTQTDNWFTSNITGVNANKVALGKFCNDRSTKNNETWHTNSGTEQHYDVGYRHLYNKATLDCPKGDVYELQAGAITADEVRFAGVGLAQNTAYYLYNGQNYWTMSPDKWDGEIAYVHYVYNNGHLNSTFANIGNNDGNTALTLRPVINLRSDITFSSGNGTQKSPYVVS